MSDIIDEIDALVNEQLSGYSERSGYDYNVNQDRCGHCHREWHGLKITERIESMAMHVSYDEDYRYADDDSEVLCPGSNFIGPWATKRQIERMRSSGLSYLDVGWIQDSDIDAIPWISPPIRNNPYARRPWQELSQLVRGDVVAVTMAGERRYVGVIVDIVERNGRVEYTTEDPHYSARAQQLRDALTRERALAREAAIRGAEASQVITDEGRPYRYGEDFSFADPTIPPEMQFPREWPDFAGALRRILEMTNPFASAIGEFGEAADHAAQALSGLLPKPDTRTPQERALPRPSTTPPMWAVDAGRQRRVHANSRRRHR